MGETDDHIRIIVYLREALLDYFRHARDVLVASNLLFYYTEGEPKDVVVPDVFVVKGVPRGGRRIYKLWVEGKAPDVVFEVTSRSTRLEDLGNKRALYAELGVGEYFIYDPLEEYLRPPLQGYRLERHEYESMRLDAEGKLHSAVLGLDLQIVQGDLRLIDPRTGRLLSTPGEAFEAAREAQAESERLRAELAKLRGEKD
jgi:Uma2 family endonuclease